MAIGWYNDKIDGIVDWYSMGCSRWFKSPFPCCAVLNLTLACCVAEELGHESS